MLESGEPQEGPRVGPLPGGRCRLLRGVRARDGSWELNRRPVWETRPRGLPLRGAPGSRASGRPASTQWARLHQENVNFFQ